MMPDLFARLHCFQMSCRPRSHSLRRAWSIASLSCRAARRPSACRTPLAASAMLELMEPLIFSITLLYDATPLFRFSRSFFFSGVLADASIFFMLSVFSYLSFAIWAIFSFRRISSCSSITPLNKDASLLEVGSERSYTRQRHRVEGVEFLIRIRNLSEIIDPYDADDSRNHGDEQKTYDELRAEFAVFIPTSLISLLFFLASVPGPGLRAISSRALTLRYVCRATQGRSNKQFEGIRLIYRLYR